MSHKPTDQDNWLAASLASLPEDLRDLHLAARSRGMMPTDWLDLVDLVDAINAEEEPGE
jgi:hypothetical protein